MNKWMMASEYTNVLAGVLDEKEFQRYFELYGREWWDFKEYVNNRIAKGSLHKSAHCKKITLGEIEKLRASFENPKAYSSQRYLQRALRSLHQLIVAFRHTIELEPNEHEYFTKKLFIVADGMNRRQINKLNAAVMPKRYQKTFEEAMRDYVRLSKGLLDYMQKILEEVETQEPENFFIRKIASFF